MPLHTVCSNFIMLSILLCYLAVISLIHCHPNDPSFEDWKVEFDRRYYTQSEENYRREMFHKNLAHIGMVRGLHPETEFKANQFADISAEEFQGCLMPPRPPTKFDPSYTHAPKGGEVPDEFDWRNHNAVTPVKNQGTVGTCWTFSAVGNIEGQWAIKSGSLVSLSEEQVVDCDASSFDCGINGGFPYQAMGYIKRAGGIETDASYPYCVGTGGCYPCYAPDYDADFCTKTIDYCEKSQSCDAKVDPSKFVPGLKVKTSIPVSSNETLIRDSLFELGPLSVCIDASHLQFYQSGVLDSSTCSKTLLDHAVLLVGYGTYKGVYGDKPYWLVKNSWSDRWGMDGYFLLLRGENMCGVAEEVVSAVLE